jgi:hypothetical protein
VFYDESYGWPLNTWTRHVDDQSHGRVSLFQRDVLDVLGSTVSCSMNEPPGTFEGLACLVGPDKAFAQDTKPQVVIITPTEDYSSDLEYPDHINAIRQVLRDLVFRDVSNYKDEHFVIVKYSRGHGDDNSVDYPDDGGHPQYYRFLDGKFMLQYDPRQVVSSDSQQGKAALEVWAELSSQPVFRTEWDVLSVLSTPSASRTSTTTGLTTIGATSSAFPSMTLSLNKPYTLVTISTHSPFANPAMPFFTTIATSVTATGLRPGFGGIPGYAYVEAADGQRCVEDYCNCGGTVAPLLTMTVSGGAKDLNCRYFTQPSWNRYPGDPTASPTPTSKSWSSSPPPPPPTPDYAQGICKIHIIQMDTGGDIVTHNLTLFDASGSDMAFTEHNLKLKGDTTIRDSETPLNYDVDIHLFDRNHIVPIARGGSRGLLITFGNVAKVAFSDINKSKMPHCDVGKWDFWENRLRESDCYWAC